MWRGPLFPSGHVPLVHISQPGQWWYPVAAAIRTGDDQSKDWSELIRTTLRVLRMMILLASNVAEAGLLGHIAAQVTDGSISQQDTIASNWQTLCNVGMRCARR